MTERPKTVTDALSQVTGRSKDEIRKIFEEVRAKSALLGSCARPHDFVEHERYGPNHPLVRTYRCTKCGGAKSATDARTYMEGLADGRAESGGAK